MDEVLLKQLVRQMKILNFWVTFFGMLFLVALVIAGILLFKAITFIRISEQKITDIQTKTSQAVDIQKQICSSSAASLLDKASSYCK